MGLCLQLPQLGWDAGSSSEGEEMSQGGRRFQQPWGGAVCEQLWLLSVCRSRACRMLHLLHFLSGLSGLCTPRSCPGGFRSGSLDSGIWKSGVPQSRLNELDLLLLGALTFFRVGITFGECHHRTCLHILPKGSAELWSFTCVQS